MAALPEPRESARAGGVRAWRTGVRSRLGRAREGLRWRAFPYLLAIRAAGSGTAVSTRAIVRDPRHVSIGAGARVGPYAELWAFGSSPEGARDAIAIAPTADIRSFALLHAYGGSIRVGRGSCVNHFCFVNGAGGVEIGDDVMIGTHSVVLSSEHGLDDLDTAMARQPSVTRPVVIEPDVYVGAHVTVLAGVRIGRGAVVAAGAVVNRDVPPGAIVGGVPARVLRRREGAAPREGGER
jgi:acetyltransferase-like isoleucine patch superfamily enzyme